MKSLLVLILAFETANASKFTELCQLVYNQYRIVRENIDSPDYLVTQDGDVIVDVLNVMKGTPQQISMRAHVDVHKLALVRQNPWLTRHWKFLTLFPLVSWKPVRGNPFVVEGHGDFSLGEIEVILPRTGDIKITIQSAPNTDLKKVRTAIQSTGAYLQSLYPGFIYDASGGYDATYIVLPTRNSYLPNNAFIQAFHDFAEEI